MTADLIASPMKWSSRRTSKTRFYNLLAAAKVFLGIKSNKKGKGKEEKRKTLKCFQKYFKYLRNILIPEFFSNI